MSVSHQSRVFKLERKLYADLCKNIGSPRALACAILAENDEWQQLLDLPINPDHYDDSQLFADDYLVSELMKKNPRLPLGLDREALAIAGFHRYEAQCAKTNVRLTSYSEGKLLPLEPEIHLAVHYAREFIRSTLGPLTAGDLHYAESKMAFGKGSTTSLSGVVTYGRKYSHREIDATPRLANFTIFGDFFAGSWKRAIGGFRLQSSSTLTTVPKNAKIDRCICVEPDLNMFFQKGIGSLIRKKLAGIGLDLNTQHEVNRELASKAHRDSLCTMDLSSASDSVSRELIWLLLPDRWAHLLHLPRVDSTTHDGKRYELNKWSSMGNGYTFELESLVFFAIIKGVQQVLGCTSDQVATFGDDMIFPQPLQRLITRTLDFLGFSVNSEKTFGKGSFFESCGTDWFRGRNVRPFYLKAKHHDFETICYIYANRIRHWANRCNNGRSCDLRMFPAWLKSFTACPPSGRHRIPDGYGDVGFASNFDEASPTPAEENGWGGYWFNRRDISARRTSKYVDGCLIAALNGQMTPFSLGREPMRGRFSDATTRRGYTLQWPHLGPWSNTSN